MKNKLAAALLAFFLGGFGAHKFYLGQTGKAVLMLLFFWTFIPGIIAFVEFFMLIFMDEETFNSKFNQPVASANVAS